MAFSYYPMRNCGPSASGEHQDGALSMSRPLVSRKFYKALVANDDPFQLRMIERILAQAG